MSYELNGEDPAFVAGSSLFSSAVSILQVGA
jgi:hypothetical protein